MRYIYLHLNTIPSLSVALTQSLLDISTTCYLNKLYGMIGQPCMSIIICYSQRKELLPVNSTFYPQFPYAMHVELQDRLHWVHLLNRFIPNLTACVTNVSVYDLLLSIFCGVKICQKLKRTRARTTSTIRDVNRRSNYLLIIFDDITCIYNPKFFTDIFLKYVFELLKIYN